MKKFCQIFTLLIIISSFYGGICRSNAKSCLLKILEIPTIIVQKPSSNTICGGEELKLKYTTTGDYASDNVFTFYFVYTLNIDNTQRITRYELGKSTLLSGEVTLKIPTDILSVYYQLEVLSSKPNSSKIYEDLSFLVLQKPEVTISGNTTINEGGATLLNMTNKFSGTASYILSDSTQAKIYYSKGYAFFLKPYKTTTYRILSVFNECGIGKSSGIATITVNPRSDKNVEIDFNEVDRFPEQYPRICSGATYTTKYKTTGEFSVNNKFTVQISDENGENFKDIVTEKTDSPLELKFTTPDNLKPSIDYRIRVIASDKDVSSAANLFPLILSAKGPTASFESSSYIFEEGKPIDIKINLTGQSPWRLIFGVDKISAKEYANIMISPLTIKISPNKTETYKIFGVYDGYPNYCPGKIVGMDVVRIELLTANEELSDLEVKLFPNPTSDKITIQSDNFKNISLQIFDNLGRQILQQNVTKSETILDMSNFKTGQYLLQIERENKRNIYKIVKL